MRETERLQILSTEISSQEDESDYDIFN